MPLRQRRRRRRKRSPSLTPYLGANASTNRGRTGERRAALPCLAGTRAARHSPEAPRGRPPGVTRARQGCRCSARQSMTIGNERSVAGAAAVHDFRSIGCELAGKLRQWLCRARKSMFITSQQLTVAATPTRPSSKAASPGRSGNDRTTPIVKARTIEIRPIEETALARKARPRYLFSARRRRWQLVL